MSIKKVLVEAGLTSRQAQIYLALREHGAVSVAELARLNGIPRVSVYSCLDDLLRRDLVNKATRNRRNFYEAQAPAILLQILEQRLLLFQNVLPILENLGPTNQDDFSIQVYKGVVQARQAQQDFYTQLARKKSKVVRSITHPEFAKAFPRFIPTMIQKRRQMGISTQLIVSADKRSQVPAIFEGESREIRLLPKKFAINCTCLISGECVMFLETHGKEPKAVLMSSKSVCELMAAFFP